MTHLTIFADDFPFDINNAGPDAIDPVKGLIGDAGIFFIHEFGKIALLYLFFRIAENPTQGIVKKPEISLQVDLVKTISHILDEDPVTVFLDFRFRLLQSGAFFT